MTIYITYCLLSRLVLFLKPVYVIQKPNFWVGVAHISIVTFFTAALSRNN